MWGSAEGWRRRRRRRRRMVFVRSETREAFSN